MQHTSYKSSKFELEIAGIKDNICPGLVMPDENGFVRIYEDAYNLVIATYPGYVKVNESCKITDCQATKYIYHANEIGIDLVYYLLKWRSK
jgi:hypothetical protein